jgi:hypothetical protein
MPSHSSNTENEQAVTNKFSNANQLTVVKIYGPAAKSFPERNRKLESDQYK